MRSIGIFVISLVLSLVLFGFLAYNIVGNTFSINFTSPTVSDNNGQPKETSGTVNDAQSGNIPGETDDGNKTGDGEQPEVQITEATFLFVGIDYQPDVIDYDKYGYDEDGFYHLKKTISADSLLLVKIDKDKKTFMFSSIPANAVVNSATSKTIKELYSERGSAYMVDCVYALTGIKAEHLAVINIGDCIAAFEKIGKITYDVPCDMQAEYEWQEYKIDLKAGKQELSPEDVVNMLRFKDYEQGSSYSRDKLLVDFAQVLFRKLTEPSNLGTAAQLFGDVIGFFETSFTVSDFTDHLDLLFLYPEYQTKVITYPGYTKNLDGREVLVPNTSEGLKLFAEYK